MGWLVSGMRVSGASAQPRGEGAGPGSSRAAVLGPCRGQTARKAVGELDEVSNAAVRGDVVEYHHVRQVRDVAKEGGGV